MKLKTITPQVIERITEKCTDYRGKVVQGTFSEQELPHLNSSLSGSVDENHKPNWFTNIHDILEQELVVYDPIDIEKEAFLECKISLLPHHLYCFLYDPRLGEAVVELKMNIHGFNLEEGTFQFRQKVVESIHTFYDYQSSQLIA